MATSSAQDKSKTCLMPGSFNAHDYAEYHDDPFEILAQVQDAWRNREPPTQWSATNLTGPDIPDMVWQIHDAPAALSQFPEITDDVLINIVHTSIEKVRGLAAEENRRIAEEEAEKEERREKNEGAQAKKLLGPDGDPYLPIIIIDEAASNHTETNTEGHPGAAESGSSSEESIHSANVSILPDSTDDAISARRAEAVRAMTQSLEKSKAYGLRKRLFSRGGDKATAKTVKIEDTPESSGFDFLKRRLVDSHNHTRHHTKSVAEVPGKVEATESTEEELVECVSCLDEFPSSQLIKVPCHSYCSICFASLISTGVQNEQQWPPKCCLNEIPFRTILKYASKELQEQFKDRASEWNTPVSQRVYCGHTDCSLWIRPDYINLALRQGRCSSGHWTCTICHGPEHGNEDCPQDRDMTLTNQLAEEAGWKRCYNCNALVEHKEACQHMSCRCGSHFCYVCCRRWRTCSCTMDQLQELKSAAEARRTERESKERAETEELRQILAEIEEFEREEALKAEMLRQEQIRQEEERQQRELEERVRRETARRQSVEEQFAELRSALSQIHELQRVMIKVDHDKASASLKEDIRATQQQAETMQTEEMEKLATDMQAKLREKEVAFNEDFAARAAAEKKLLDEYHRNLIAYYQNRPRGAEEIAKAMVPVQQKMEKSYRDWQKWKKQEMVTYRELLGEEQTIKEELAHNAKERLADKHQEMELYLSGKNAAEKHWFRLVVLERENLVGELELQEMEGGVDGLFAMGESVSGAGEDSIRSSSRASSSDQDSFSLAETGLPRGDEVGEGSKPRLMPDESSLTVNPWAVGTALTTEGQTISKAQEAAFRWGRAIDMVAQSSS